MLRNWAIACATLVFLVSSCERKAKSTLSGGYAPPPPLISADAVPVLKPTRPSGGIVEGKISALDPEESEKRRIRNTAEPIVFGEKVAGISMVTRQSEALGILSQPIANIQGVLFYGEHLRLIWDEGSDPSPFVIAVDEGYAGALELPAPYGKVMVGQSLAALLPDAAAVKKFALDIGAAFEKQGPGYDCEKALTCQIEENDQVYILDFKKGGIRIAKTPELPLSFLYLIQPQRFYPRSTDPILYNLSVAGTTFSTSRGTFENRFGPATAQNADGFLFYDRQSIGILWGSNNTPIYMEALGTYQGTMDFGGSIGIRKINDSFATYAPATDNGTELMKILDRNFNKRDPSYDCTTQTPQATCRLAVDDTLGLIQIELGRSSFLFTKSPERIWLTYLVQKP